MQVLAEGGALANHLIELGGDSRLASAGLFRVYSPSYSLPQQTSAVHGLQLADGVDPLQLDSYVHFMKKASGVPIEGYSVTLPPFSSGDPASDNAGFQPDPARLKLLNVHYVAAAFNLDVDGLDYLGQIGQTRLYLVRDALPRAWIQPEGLPDGEQARPVEQIDWSPERVMIQANGPGVLVLSEIAYPGWRVWVDGQLQSDLLDPRKSEGLLRAVRLDPGLHQVVFAFRPISVYLGTGQGISAWLWMIGIQIYRSGKAKRLRRWGKRSVTA